MPFSVSQAFSIGLLATVAPAVAAERTSFEKKAGWEVERTVGDTSANPCIMSHSYKDKDDDNAENTVIFALDGSKAVLVLGYQNWEWDKDEKVKAAFLVGKKVISAQPAWVGTGTILKGVFPDTIVPDLLAGKTIVLRFDDGEANFAIAGFPQAYESLRRCDSTPVKAPTAEVPPAATAPPFVAAQPQQVTAPPHVAAAPPPAAPPTEPGKPQLTAFFVGLLAQRTIKECDFPTTFKQRAAVDAKVAALQPNDRPQLIEELRQEAARNPTSCPDGPDKAARYQENIRNFVEMSPETYVALMEKRMAEREAQAAPTQAAPAPAQGGDPTLCKAANTAPAVRVEACSRALGAKTLANIDRIALLMARADAQFGTKDFDGAITDYDAILATAPNNIEALKFRGLMYYLKRIFEKALADQNAVLRIEPRNAISLLGRGSTYEEMGRTDEALADYDQSILIEPNAGAYASRARIRAAKGETERAIADLDEAIRLEPNESDYRDEREKLIAGRKQGQGEQKR